MAGRGEVGILGRIREDGTKDDGNLAVDQGTNADNPSESLISR
jgi:hypothetical protein